MWHAHPRLLHHELCQGMKVLVGWIQLGIHQLELCQRLMVLMEPGLLELQPHYSVLREYQ